MYTFNIEKRLKFNIIIFIGRALPPSCQLRQVYISAYLPNIIPNKDTHSKASVWNLQYRILLFITKLIRNFCCLFITFRLPNFRPLVIIFSSPAHILIFSKVISHFNWFHFKSLSNKNQNCYFFEPNLKTFCGKRRKPRRTTQLCRDNMINIQRISA